MPTIGSFQKLNLRSSMHVVYYMKNIHIRKKKNALDWHLLIVKLSRLKISP